ncbi:MAG: hypothetical protein QF701_13995 [Nitrospinota bacterium]|nr:hypothetical protein [Nitrospinota bacterium]MDP7369252.1 hypothetical protein [Nitrospinota bacterium]MDP7502863.1 hypothetical protein [Nitrospinota bacterium]MDP7664158.1 hypothetical protein [Nitrospinota bacterium]
MKKPTYKPRTVYIGCMVLAAALSLSGCTESLLIGPQVPGRGGLLNMLHQFEIGTKWRDWTAMLDAFYLPDHANEVKKKFGSDLRKWFRSDRATAALTTGEIGEVRRLCVLALREKRLSPRYDPHYVVYYRVHVEPCRSQIDSPTPGIAEGQMEWGFETKQSRWVHLRSLG